MKHLLALGVLLVGVSLAQAQQPPPTTGALAVVVKLYKDFPWDPRPERDFLDQPKAVLTQYLDAPLSDLVLKDRACVKRYNAICNLDVDPIWNSQDPEGMTPTVEPTSDAAVVRVTLRYEGQPEVLSRLTYRMVQTKAGWRVHDIEYERDNQGWSLVRTLSKKQ